MRPAPPSGPVTSSACARSSSKLCTAAQRRITRRPSSSGKRQRGAPPAAPSITGCHSVSSRPQGMRVSITRPPAHGVTTTQRTRATEPSAARSASPGPTASIGTRRGAPSAPRAVTRVSGAKQPPPRMNSAGSTGAGAAGAQPPTATGTPSAAGAPGCTSSEGSGAFMVAKAVSARLDWSSNTPSCPSASLPKCCSAWSRKLERRSARSMSRKVRK
mmetsp:Transcript_35792/g.119699  ORF Transcript_35792/g.119699 Transcript_35792/m.119699 type:complete len:216 (+) Transcript_35792:491-1138(+)